MKRLFPLFVAALLSTSCEKSSPNTARPGEGTAAPRQPADPLLGQPVIPNPDAREGDVTICPYSGRKFVVEANSPRWEYEGTTYVFCAQKALDEVKRDPAKYLGEAHG